MASQHQHKTAVVAVFLAALVLALPAAAYGQYDSGYAAGGAAGTPAAVSTPAEAGTPVANGYKPGAAAGTPAEAIPTEASTPAEADTPVADGYKPGAAASTPVEATPTDSTPAEATPTDSAPAEATPTDSTPAEATPTEAAASTPAEAGTPVADGYKPGAAASTPAEATPADSTPAASTPAEATPSDSTPTEATPTDAAAASTPAESGTPSAPGYTPATAAAASTTPAADSAKATTDVQKLMEMVNGAYKKALEAANSASPTDKYTVFAAALNKACKEGVADRPTMKQRGTFTEMINSAVRDAYSFTPTTLPADQRYSVFISSLTEALRVMAASMDVHAVKPAAEEAIAGGVKEPAGDSLVIGKIDAAVKAAAGAAKEARLNEKYIVFRAAFSKALKDTIGAVCDEKTIPQLSFAYRQVYKALFSNTAEKRFNAFIFGLSQYITGVAIATKKASEAAAKAGAAPAKRPDFFTQPVAQDAAKTKPAADAAYKPAAEAAAKPAPEATAKPAPEATAAKPATEAAYKPATEAAAKPAPEATAAKPAGGAVGGYNL